MVKRVAVRKQPPVEPGMVQVQEETKRTFIEPLTVVDNELEIPEAEVQWFDKFIDEIEAGQTFTLRVEQLPNWSKDGRSGVQADREFKINLPFSREMADSYEEQVQRMFGGGHYQFELRGGASDIRRRWTRHIGNPPNALPGVPTINGNPGNYTFNYPPPASTPGSPPPDPLKMFNDQISMATNLVKLGQSLAPSPGTPLAPQDPNQSPAIVELKTRMEMFERIAGLAPEKQEPLVKLVKGLGLLGDESDSASGDRWLRLFEGLAPVLQMGLGLLMQRLIPPGGVQGAQPVNQPVAGQLGGIAPQPATPPDPAGLMLAQVTGLIGTGIQQGQTSGPAIAVIEELTNNFPNSQAAQQCELILNRPPAEVAQQLGIAHPDAVRWIGVLQTNWKLEDDNTTGPLGPPEVMTFGGDAQ